MKKEIHIFDLDDTLLETPTFADFVDTEHDGIIDTSAIFTEYFTKIKSIFLNDLSKEVIFLRKNDFVVPVDAKTKKPFSFERVNYFKEDKYKRFFEEKDGIMVISSFPGFHGDINTLGKVINEPIIKIYRDVQNKMILTGRSVKIHDNVSHRLGTLGVELPNFGIKTFKMDSHGIQAYKIRTIASSIEENNWEIVHFYEDNKSWLFNAKQKIEELFPKIEFIPHFITNVKDKFKL